METFLIISNSVIFETKKQKVALKHPKIKQAMFRTVYRLLHEHLFFVEMNRGTVK